MKQLDKFVFKSFLPPYIMSFFVAEFVLLMQFLWKYIDEILGKGFSLGVLLELLFYFAVTIIPMAIPITILISSVMVFGNMAEKFELSSFKSSGISLMRIMAAGIFIAILTGMFSLFASNYLKPKANYKFLERFNSVRRQKPALSIEKDVYNKDFSGYAIYVGDKDKDEVGIHDILIYDHTANDKSKVNFVKAKDGEMYSEEESGSFIMQLYDGEQYRELEPEKKTKTGADQNSNPFMRTRFETWKKIFDMSEFEMDAQSINLSRKKFDLLNSFQLMEAIDTLEKEIKTLSIARLKDYKQMLDESAFLAKGIDLKKDKKDTKKEKNETKEGSFGVSHDILQIGDPSSADKFIESFDEKSYKIIVTGLRAIAKDRVDRLGSAITKDRGKYKDWSYHQLRLHQQFSWALICIIFLFIGGPFGSIVRKGGYGYPLLVSIIFFVLFIIMNIMGEKLNKSESIHPILAAWLPCIVLLPLAFYFTMKAVNDRALNLSMPWFIKRHFESDDED